MEKSLPLNDCEAKKTHIVINRLHSFTHGAALVALIYYRITSIASLPKTTTILPHILIFIAELTLSFIWLLAQAANWNPVARTAYPDRLPGDENLPSIDVFICTADPIKEPSLDVMNTVISAMALDYPPNKLHLYLSDDGGSPVTLRALKHASDFSKLWIPFCRKYMVKNRCPKAYFFGDEVNDKGEVDWSDEFVTERKEIEKAYEDFKCCLGKIFAETDVRVSRDHPPIVEQRRKTAAPATLPLPPPLHLPLPPAPSPPAAAADAAALPLLPSRSLPLSPRGGSDSERRRQPSLSPRRRQRRRKMAAVALPPSLPPSLFPSGGG